MQLELFDFNTFKKVGEIEVSEAIFGCDFNEPLVHQVVNWYLANARQGTHAQKTRAQVRGGGRKPRPQKGSGGSRAGTIRSPLWRKGGKVFAATTQDYSQKLNKKMFRGAIKSIISELNREKRIKVFQDLTLDSHKTKNLVDKLKENNISDCVIVLDNENENLSRAMANVPNIKLIDLKAINPVDLLKFGSTVLTKSVVHNLGENLQ